MSGFTEIISGNWKGGFTGSGQLHGIGTLKDIVLPQEMGGKGGGANPEQLLLGAAGGCLMATLGIIFEKVGVPYKDIEVTSVLTMDKQLPPSILAVTHNLRISSTESADKITTLAQRAEAMCVIGRALADNIQVTLNVEVVSTSKVTTRIAEVSL